MRSARATEQGDIAIVGMACLFPGADTPQRFFANICAKLEFIRDPVASWGAPRYLAGIGGTLLPTVRGGYLGEAYAADTVGLGVMPSSVDGSEPDHFLALAIAQAALEDAGALGADHSRTGVILGHSSYLHRGNAAMVQHGVVLDQTRELLAQLLPGADGAVLDRIRAAMLAELPPFTADMAPGLVPNVMTGRIANRLDLRGPNYIVDAACSSAHLSVQAAMIELRSGRSDMMLAGGVNASISAEVYMVFNQLGALAGSGRVRPFSEGGDGTLMGEGLGILALKRVEDAVANGDRIYAVLKGMGQSSDGKGSGILAPRMEGEMLAIERALIDAGQDPKAPDIPGLIECHGTGIPLGDRTEIGALKGIFGPRAGDGLPRTAIGSVKSMIGHCIPAAGAAGLIKTSLALYHKTLPPTLSDAIRPGLPIDETGLYLNTEARPWIAAPGTRRRASVNAFGFGGINAHAVLEEAPAGAEAAPAHWPHELFLLSAETPAALAEKARALAGNAARHAQAPLSSIAHWAARNAGTGPARLAFTASSAEDLAEKLAKAAERLSGDKPSFRLRSGVVAAAAPTGGKLAFMFPGEGAQYQGMLAEILTVFPHARAWFDFWDGLFPARSIPPSAVVFPPPTTLDPALAKSVGDRLFGLELGSESVFIAAQALMAVLTDLGIRPDVVVGHSSGEHSALAAAGVFGGMGAQERDAFAKRIRSLNDLYQAIEASGGIAGGALLTVGGVPRERILALADADSRVHLALDNCEHQAVLYGPRPRMEEIVEALRPEGGMCSFLPFDRPYHTPLFTEVAKEVARVYSGMDFRPPTLPIWSCATVSPMPADANEVRALAAYQWASRVRFTETTQALHDDGVRIFLEVGPSANLTGFVDDALKGRAAMALPLDSRRQGGLAHFLQCLGRLWVAGRDFDAGALFDARGLAELDLAAAPPKDRKRPITNTLAYVRLPNALAAELSADLMASLGKTAAAPAGVTAPPAVPRIAPPPAPHNAASAEVETEAVVPANPDEPSHDLGGFFGVMQQFLDMQGAVMEAAMGTPAADAGPAEWQPPLLHRVTLSGDALEAFSDFDPLTDPFIAQHVLYADRVSDIDAGLQALPVLPLAVSLEMVVEAAAVLTGHLAARLENVAARDWVAFDAGPATLTTTARLLPGDETRVAVQILRGQSLLFEAEAVIDPGPELPPLPPLGNPQPPRWRDDQLYSTGMFHGPLFRGVASLTRFDDGGLDARLADLPLDHFFGHGEDPGGLLLNPALLDQLGHVTAFWIAQGAGTDFSSFPSSIARIDLGAARSEASFGATISGRISFRDAHDAVVSGPAEARFLQGDFEARLPDGTLLMRASGWRDRFFRVPHAFYQARFRPREAWYGSALEVFAPDPDVTVWQVPAFPHGFLEDAGGIWMRVLATTILSADERAQWAAMPAAGKRRRDWIVGRIALKEAARAWIAAHGGPLFLPADIEIRVAEGGKPFVDGAALGCVVPEVSLSHVQGRAVAVAAPPGHAAGVDIEISGQADAALLREGGFGPQERVLLNGSDPLFGWCAKEAVAKAIGQGLNGRPKSFALTQLAQGAAEVQTPEGRRVSVALAQDGLAVLALAILRPE